MKLRDQFKDYHKYDVKIVQNPDNQVVVSEKWRMNRKLHRENGPAVIVRDERSGEVIEEYWYRNGKLHREGGPAVIDRSERNSVSPDIAVTEMWFQDGELHRENGPAMTLWDWAGNLASQGFFLNGRNIRPKRLSPSQRGLG